MVGEDVKLFTPGVTFSGPGNIFIGWINLFLAVKKSFSWPDKFFSLLIAPGEGLSSFYSFGFYKNKKASKITIQCLF